MASTDSPLKQLVSTFSPEEEVVQMVERLLEDDDVLAESPFLRRIREAGREEGREAGVLAASCHDIAHILTLRFTPSEVAVQEIEHHLAVLTEEAQLERLLTVAVQSPQLADFQVALAREQQG